MWNFINLPIFNSILTLIVGTFAFLVYLKQKSDTKKSAASIILIEIQNAEDGIKRVRESVRRGILQSDSTILPTNSWKNNRHLFSKDFDRDEWDEISQFYNKCELLDEAIKYNNSAFINDVEQIRQNKQRVLAEYARQLLDSATLPNQNVDELTKQFNDKVTIFDQIYMNKQQEYMYTPQKPLNDAKIYLEDLKNLSTTTVGQKLKSIPKKWFFKNL